jgi:hypothetical protein
VGVGGEDGLGSRSFRRRQRGETWGEDGGWWGDEDMDLQAMGKSLEWDFCGLALAVSGELVGMGFFFFSFFSFPG